MIYVFFGECSSKATSLEGSKLTPVAISLLCVGRFPSSSFSSSSDFDPSVSWENSLERRKERKKEGGGGAPRFRGFSKKSVDFSAWGFTLTLQPNIRELSHVCRRQSKLKYAKYYLVLGFFCGKSFGGIIIISACATPQRGKFPLSGARELSFWETTVCVCVAKKRWMPSTTPYARCSKWHTPFSFIYLL